MVTERMSDDFPRRTSRSVISGSGRGWLSWRSKPDASSPSPARAEPSSTVGFPFPRRAAMRPARLSKTWSGTPSSSGPGGACFHSTTALCQLSGWGTGMPSHVLGLHRFPYKTLVRQPRSEEGCLRRSSPSIPSRSLVKLSIIHVPLQETPRPALP